MVPCAQAKALQRILISDRRSLKRESVSRPCTRTAKSQLTFLPLTNYLTSGKRSRQIAPESAKTTSKYSLPPPSQSLTPLFTLRYDLIAHETVYLHPEDIVDADDVDITNVQVSRPARILQSVINGDEATIHRLEEPYPSECYNHGKLAKMSQKYYMCQSRKSAQPQKSDQPFRVAQETYNFLLSNYSDQYSCYTQNVENNVCVCPGGSVDFECNTELKQKCYINITSPPFYQGCEDRPDSFEYLYSVPGFSPCYP